MEEVEFRSALLRTVSGQINARRPELTRNVIRILTHVHLAAELDHRLTRSEKEALSSAIDAFETRIKEMTFNPKDKDSKEEGYLYISHFYSNCCNQRVVHGFESLINEVLKSGFVDSSRNLELVRLVFDRLKALNWMEGLKSKVGPLGAKILQKIESKITAGVKDEQWCELMKTVSEIVQSVTSSAKSVHGLMKNALCKLQSLDTTDNCRLIASESLAIIAAQKKDPQLHISAMFQSVLSFVHEIVDFMLKPYEEESLEALMMPQSIESTDYDLSVKGFVKASIKGLIKVFAGGIDLLERLLTTLKGLHLIPVDQILSICFRILSMNANQISKNSGTLHSFEMMAVLPGMQFLAWKILKLILSMNCKTLLKHFRKITQILNHALSDFDSTSVQVSCSLYEATEQYLRVTGLAGVINVSKSVIQALKSEFQEYIGSSKKQDFHPIRKKAKTTGKRKKTKEIEQLAAEVELFLSQKNDQTKTGSIERHPSQQSIIQLVYQLLELGANIIPLDEFHVLETLISQICINCRNVEEIQVEIYTLLQNCIKTTTRYRSRLLSMGVWMFQEGCNASSVDTRVFCRRALLDLDLLMHPRSLAMMPPIVEVKSKVSLDHHGVDDLDVLTPVKEPTDEDLASSPMPQPVESMELDSDEELPEIDSGESE